MRVEILCALAILFGSPRAQGAWGVAYGPRSPSTPISPIVFLHGMWASPEDSCEAFDRAATPFGVLVCPRGNARLGDSGTLKMWSGTFLDAARSIHAALDAAEALAPGKLERRQGGTLLGFSNGAYFAAEVACSEPGRWSGLVLMSMKLDLDARRLRAAGVKRVFLAAGDRDEARVSMEGLARKLNGAGVEARYASLGDVGHEFPTDMGARMCDAIAWVRSSDPQRCESAASDGTQGGAGAR
jgi:predicted esterase